MKENLSERLAKRILTGEEAEQVAGGGVIYLDPDDPNNQGHVQGGNG